MSALQVSARPRTRLVPVLVSALVAALAVFGLSPVPAADAADPVLSFVAAASSSGNRASHLTLPTGIQAGDTMVLFMTTNSIAGTLGAPAGWTLLQSRDGTATRGRAWTKQAVAASESGTRHRHLERHHQGHHERRGLPRPAARPRSPPRPDRRHHLHHQPRLPARRGRPGRFLAGQLLEREVLDRPQTWTKPATAPPGPTPPAPAAARSAPCSPTPARPLPPAPPRPAPPPLASPPVASSSSPSWSAPAPAPSPRRPTPLPSRRSPPPAPA